jgi:hypothetical protein
MEQQHKDFEAVESIVSGWVAMSMENPELTAHVWLRAIGIMSGLTLSLSGAGETEAEGAMNVVSRLAMDVYRDTPKARLAATLQ